MRTARTKGRGTSTRAGEADDCCMPSGRGGWKPAGLLLVPYIVSRADWDWLGVIMVVLLLKALAPLSSLRLRLMLMLMLMLMPALMHVLVAVVMAVAALSKPEPATPPTAAPMLLAAARFICGCGGATLCMSLGGATCTGDGRRDASASQSVSAARSTTTDPEGIDQIKALTTMSRLPRGQRRRIRTWRPRKNADEVHVR